MAVAQIISDHRGSIARTLRETFGIGLTDLGDGVSWGEAKLLIEEAAADPGTAFGAELAGWAYPATTLQLLSLLAEIGDAKASRRVMPWTLEGARKGEKPSADEVAIAAAELDESIVFS